MHKYSNKEIVEAFIKNDYKLVSAAKFLKMHRTTLWKITQDPFLKDILATVERADIYEIKSVAYAKAKAGDNTMIKYILDRKGHLENFAPVDLNINSIVEFVEPKEITNDMKKKEAFEILRALRDIKN